MTDEPTYDEAERAEAEALARALQTGNAPDERAADAIDAAQVVRLLKAPLLNDERATAVLAETERRIAAARRRTWQRIAFAGVAASALAAAAAMLLVVRAPVKESSVVRAPSAAEAPAAAASAPPSAAAVGGEAARTAAAAQLRTAQIARLTTPSVAAYPELDRALREYRDEQLSALDRRYAR